MTVTVGVLYPGDLGSTLGGLLAARGVRVVTTLRDRSARTGQRCRDSGLIVRDSLADVVRESDIVLSMVPPHAAEHVADAYCELFHLAPPSALFVDLNSIGPELAGSLATKFADFGRDFVDGAINGLASKIATGGTLYLSGARAPEVAELVLPSMRVCTLGDEPGRASAMKMLLGGLSKGVCALFLELAVLARQREMLPEMLEACSQIYPGISALAERMLPTYPQAAARRADEMAELKKTFRASGLEPSVIDAVWRAHEELAAIPLGDMAGSTIGSLVERVINGRLDDVEQYLRMR